MSSHQLLFRRRGRLTLEVPAVAGAFIWVLLPEARRAGELCTSPTRCVAARPGHIGRPLDGMMSRMTQRERGFGSKVEATVRAAALRHIKRDDMLHLAAEATSALGILGPENDRFGTNTDIYASAIKVHLRSAFNSSFWSVKVNSLSRAAILLRFCIEMASLDPTLGLALEDDTELGRLLDGRTPRVLLHEARTTLDKHEDRYRAVKLSQVEAREMRLSGDHAAARQAATPSDWDTFFTRSGAELHKANLALELLFVCVSGAGSDMLEDVAAQLRRMQDYWKKNALARMWATRGRYDQAVAISHLLSPQADGELRSVLDGLYTASLRFETYSRAWRVERHIETLSVLVTHAELCLHTAALFDDADEAARLRELALTSCRRALRKIEGLRKEWTVVTRAPSPLSFLLRLTLGNLAQVASEMGESRQAALLGLQLSLTAKHSGIAELIRAQRAEFGGEATPYSADVRSMRALVSQLVQAEQARAVAPSGVKRRRAADLVDRLRKAIPEQLAALVFPADITGQDVERISELASDRIVVDFVRLPVLVASEAEARVSSQQCWFCTTILAPDTIRFDVLELKGGFDALFAPFFDTKKGRTLFPLDVFDRPSVAGSEGWRLVTDELFHPELLRRLRQPKADIPILISPHSDLSRLPWLALLLDDEGTRLVERAQVLVGPLLTGFKKLSDAVPGSPALVAIVNSTDDYNPLRHQDVVRAEWGLPGRGDRTELAVCTAPDWQPQAVDQRMTVEGLLNSHDASFVYLTAHGRGSGFAQLLDFPEGSLTAAAALACPWPECVILNACYSGALDDLGNAEPMGFVVAAMAGGARVVVGGVQIVYSKVSARFGAEIVRRIKLDGNRTPLHMLLHEQQRAHAKTDIRYWASLTTFVS